ncbi:MAG: hypothetical protein Q8Q09_28015 [Deltaproteobacteria bacterium]|nr:hypothetical protein [Deltaproteobacteria bacterium]
MTLASLGACREPHRDPLASRPRAAMTAQEIEAGLPQTTASGPEVERARQTMLALRAVVGFWRLEHGGRTRCPTLLDLSGSSSSGFDRATMSQDPWGSSYEIDCVGGVVRLRSLGPDRRAETADDILRF